MLRYLKFGYNFNCPQADGSLACSFKGIYSRERANRILKLAKEQGCTERIVTEELPKGMMIGFITPHYGTPLTLIIRQQRLVTLINKGGNDVQETAQRIGELFRSVLG